MKLTLEIDRNPSLGPYSQNDEVTGTVRFQNGWSYITCIKVSLQGRIYTCIKHDENGYDLKEDNYDYHKLFKTSLIVFPEQDVVAPSRGFSLPKGKIHSFPFKLRFPPSTSCLKEPRHDGQQRFQLPPAFSTDSRSLNARIIYLLRAKVKRSFGLPRQLLCQNELDFVPLFLPRVPNFSRTLDDSPLMRLHKPLKFDEGDLEFRTELISQYLCSGDVLGVAFAIYRHGISNRRLNLVLEFLEIDLQTTVTITHPTRTSKASSKLSIAKLDLQKRISMPTGVATYRVDDPTLYQIIVPSTKSGFIACAVKVQHILCIQAKFSSGTAAQITQCAIPVAISSCRIPEVPFNTAADSFPGTPMPLPSPTTAPLQSFRQLAFRDNLSPHPPPYSENPRDAALI